MERTEFISHNLRLDADQTVYKYTEFPDKTRFSSPIYAIIKFRESTFIRVGW